MECLNPIKIVNPTKYVNLHRRDVILQYVPCGKCANCQQNNRNIWYFRAFSEFKDTIEKGGYVLFDCLTYSEEKVPRVTNYFPDLDEKYDFRCFDYEHLRKFLVLLRRRLRKYKPEKTLRYFASTEYGTKRTKRPHIHILFYVTNKSLDSLTLSRAISSCWKYGRTDGLPYKSRKYVLYNTLCGDLSQSLRVCSYVSKYVMKDSKLQKHIDSKIGSIMQSVYEDYAEEYRTFEDFLSSECGKRVSRRVCAHLNQFHRQSLGFGLSALRDMDIDEIMRTNIMKMPDYRNSVLRIPLSTYYKRKLFYQLVEVDGVKCWQPTELGLQYLDIRKTDLRSILFERFKVAAKNNNVVIDDDTIKRLVFYILERRGRIKSDLDSLPIIEDRLKEDLIYKYVTSCDKENFGQRFVTSQYLGNKLNYDNESLYYSISLNDFITQYVYFDDDLESILFKLEKKKTAENIQSAYDRKQELSKLYKELF